MYVLYGKHHSNPTNVVWVNVSLIVVKVLVNSRWQITLYEMYNYVWCKLYEDQDNLYVISKYFEREYVYFHRMKFTYIYVFLKYNHLSITNIKYSLCGI